MGVTEGPNLPPSLLFFLTSFLWFFLRLRNIKKCVVIFLIYVLIFPIPPPVTSFAVFFLIPILCPPPLRQGGLPTPCPRGFTLPPVLPDDLLSSLTVKQSVSILHDFGNMVACLSLWKMDSAFFKESGFLWSNLKAHMAVFLCYLPHLASSRQYCWSTKQSTLGNFFAFVSIQIEIVFFA